MSISKSKRVEKGRMKEIGIPSSPEEVERGGKEMVKLTLEELDSPFRGSVGRIEWNNICSRSKETSQRQTSIQKSGFGSSDSL